MCRGADSAQILASTPRCGADVVVEANGTVPLELSRVLSVTAIGGRVVLANTRGTARLGARAMTALMEREVTIAGSRLAHATPEQRGASDAAVVRALANGS